MGDIQVYAAERTIVVKGAARKIISVFDAVGRQVVSTKADDDTVRLTMEEAGVYMVQVGDGRAYRVMLMQ